jgi:hypothetical protein
LSKTLADKARNGISQTTRMENSTSNPAVAAPAPIRVYYVKAHLSNPIIVKGTRVNFENVGGNWGVIALDPNNGADKELIDGLNHLVSDGVGGVGRISAEEYAQKKSQQALNPSDRPKELLRLRPSGPRPRQVQPPPEVIALTTGVPTAEQTKPGSEEPPLDLDNLKGASEVSQAAEAPTEAFRPPTRRISRSKTPTAQVAS